MMSEQPPLGAFNDLSNPANRPPVRIAPDPARDARVAARRAEDAARAGRALDALLSSRPLFDAAAYKEGWHAGYDAALQHNRHYGVPLTPQQEWHRGHAEKVASCTYCAYGDQGV